MEKAIVATITDVDFIKPYKRVRANCTLKTFELAKECGYSVVVVDAGSPPDYVTEMRRRGALVYPQEEPGMGNAQRQVLQQALDIAQHDDAIVWTESEKYPLIPKLNKPVTVRNKEDYDLVMLRRTSLNSYPPEQAMSYRLIALAMEYLTGIDSDFGWGPTILGARAIDYYTNYVSHYGDTWDAIHCPKLHIINDGRPWTIVPVDYEHPPEQTAAEAGMTLFMKRIYQVEQLVDAMTREVGRLGILTNNIQRHER